MVLVNCAMQQGGNECYDAIRWNTKGCLIVRLTGTTGISLDLKDEDERVFLPSDIGPTDRRDT